jgi:hypothetical protein
LPLPLPTMPPAVDAAVLNAYVDGVHPGPNENNMPISWNLPMTHAWNRKVIQLLTAEFKNNVKACKYQLMTTLPTDLDKNYIKRAIRSKLASRRTELNSSMRKATQAKNLTPAEISASFDAERKRRLLNCRRNERRKNVSF